MSWLVLMRVCVMIDLNACGCVLIDLNACGRVVFDLNAYGRVVSNGHTRTCTHNLGVPAGFNEEEEEEEEEGKSELEGVAPTPKRCKLARETALKVLQSGLYQVFSGLEGPTHNINPSDNNALDYFLLLWPASLCELITLETSRYALLRGIASWQSVSTTEVWTGMCTKVRKGMSL